MQVYAALAARWDAAITDGVTQLIRTAIAANAAQLAAMLTLYVMIVGVLTMFGRMTWAEFVFGATRAGIISLLLSAPFYTQFVQTPLMETIPNWIAQAANGGLGATAGPQQFDALRNAVIAHEATILQQATGLFNIPARIETAMITWFILLELTLSFIIWEFARGMIGFLVATGPFLVGFYLFRATRSIATNLAGQAVSLLLMQLLLAVMVALELVANNAFMQQAQADPGAGIDVQIDTMANIALFFLFGVAITLLAPIIASRIGHGVLPSFAPLVRGPMSLAQRAWSGGFAAPRSTTVSTRPHATSLRNARS